jgi:hypothetical protein
MKKALLSTAFLLLSLSMSVSAFGQGAGFAAVTGTVTDDSGALIPGATLRATLWTRVS